MKTVAKINPEKEYENAKNIIDLASKQKLNTDNLKMLDSSVDNLITAARVLMEREDTRRGKRKPPPKDDQKKGRKEGDQREESQKRPSERYPSAEINETITRPDHPPICPCCNNEMKESGLFDTTEKLETIPKRFYIERNKRPKYNCSNCHGAMVNTPAAPSIVPKSNYGDSFIIDAVLSKYCDLIPIERYVQMAYRSGLEGLPPQSIIGLTHHFANFLIKVYEKLKTEVQSSSINLADETPQNMLEGDSTLKWYLWGFFSSVACYFEIHDTRASEVPLNFLKFTQAKYLVTDGYGGYKSCLTKLKEEYQIEIVEVNCNAHAYRYFEEASITWKTEAEPFLNLYGDIYELEKERKEKQDHMTADDQLNYRKNMLPIFEQMKKSCEEQKVDAMPESKFKKAIVYFLNHYSGLTVCATNIDIPLDTNSCERMLRAIVVGRKTWYGYHSKRGAYTSAILFSIVQSCKMNNINPRNYFPWIVDQIHANKEVLTPYEYSKLN